jgi:D-aminopeptidase
MQCFDFKGGIGTASRVLSADAGSYTVGVLVLTNFGDRPELRSTACGWARRSRT